MLSRFALTFFLIISNELSGAESQGGMPQLNPDSFVSQIFWLTIFFVLLFVSLHYFFLPRIHNLRSQREKTVENYLTETKKLNEQIENIIKQIENELNEGKSFFESEVKKTTESYKKIFEQKIKEVDQNIEEKKLNFSKNLISSKKKIEDKIPKICINLSDQLYEKVIGEKIKGTEKEFGEVLKKS
jgi:F-type H+-transporting ATPase subunit b